MPATNKKPASALLPKQKKVGDAFNLDNFLRIVRDRKLLPLARPTIEVGLTLIIPDEFLQFKTEPGKLLSKLREAKDSNDIFIDWLFEESLQAVNSVDLNESAREGIKFPDKPGAHSSFLRSITTHTHTKAAVFVDPTDDFCVDLLFNGKSTGISSEGLDSFEQAVEALARNLYDLVERMEKNEVVLAPRSLKGATRKQRCEDDDDEEGEVY